MSELARRDPDPDRPSEVVGALSWNDLGPLHRLVGWLLGRIPRVVLIVPFIVAAMGLAVWWVRQLAAAATTGPSAIQILDGAFQGTAVVLVVLMPVALLWRDPAALRTRPALVVGLAVLGASEFLGWIGLIWQVDLSSSAPFAPQSFLPVLDPLGGALVALGLLNLRVRRPKPGLLLAGILVLYVGLDLLANGIVLLQQAIGSSNTAILGPSWWSVLNTVTIAFVVWIAVDARLAHEEPIRFWGLLAMALPLRVLVAVFQVPQDVAVVAFETSLPEIVGALASAIVATSIALAFVAYLRYAPLSREAAANEDAAAPSP